MAGSRSSEADPTPAMSDQPQPVRTGDVYPPSASAHDARRQRDEVLGTHGGDQQQNQDGDLRSPRPPTTRRRRVVTATAGGQFTVRGRAPGVEEATTRDHRAARSRAQTPAGDRRDSRRRAVQSAETRHGLAAIPAAKRPQRSRPLETNMRPASLEEDRVRLMDGRATPSRSDAANKVAKGGPFQVFNFYRMP
ncbi:hypothetical protein ZWY2020_008381 [Hordeum vulgare]|nr:hypothetical protein ZWY2020_008381 [Hordeum vulgare]